jgi:hypothetical protein
MRDDPPPLTEQTAWSALRIFLEDFASLFGKPIVLARRESLAPHEHKICAAWLCALEAWLRRLLLLAAARVKLEPPHESKRRPARAARVPCASFASEDSAAWRVSFQLNTTAKRAHTHKRRKPRPRHIYNPIPLALRFEALLRAAQNPERHITRMARALARNARLPNKVFHQKLNNMSALRPYVAQCSLLLLDPFPEAWRRADTS